MRYFILCFLMFVCSLSGYTQSVNAPLNQDYYHWVDRYEIKSGKLFPGFFSSWKPYKRSAIAAFTDSLLVDPSGLSSVDQFNIAYLRNDNWEWVEEPDNNSRKAFLKRFYKVKSDLYHIDTEDFDLHINPVLYLGGGTESQDDVKTFINTRGVEVRGMIDKKLGFYSFIGENQVIFPFYVRERTKNNITVPGEGFWKDFKDGDGVDFFTARGYISFEATKHINFQFGHDRFKIGNGYRSMILSDVGPGYLFLKMNTEVWRLKYTNLYTELTADIFGTSGGLTGSGKYPEKYMALHHLSLNISEKLNIGIFESVIFDVDSASNNGFDFNYLNPIIFYRALEQQSGSPDNVLLGADFKWLPIKKVSLYGQLILDEFLLDNLKEGSGWWANKFGVQLGGEYIDAFGINNLDLQGEVNISRPYTYSHNTIYGSYSHYEQPLAHPLGSNFKEYIGIARYQPINRLYLTGKLIYANYGADTTGVNWGGNILLRNITREMDFGNEIGQGITTDLFMGDFTASYQWKHNLFIDLKLIYRKIKSDLASQNADTKYVSAAIRWNIPQRLNEF